MTIDDVVTKYGKEKLLKNVNLSENLVAFVSKRGDDVNVRITQ